MISVMLHCNIFSITLAYNIISIGIYITLHCNVLSLQFPLHYSIIAYTKLYSYVVMKHKNMYSYTLKEGPSAECRSLQMIGRADDLYERPGKAPVLLQTILRCQNRSCIGMGVGMCK